MTTTTSHFSATSHCSSVSKFVDFGSGSGGKWRSNLLLIRTLRSRSLTRSFSVKNVSGEPKTKLKNPISDGDASSIASSIKYHAEFTPVFSPEKFELPKAFVATAQSVRDALIINWNATYECYDRLNLKQAYYLSMEFLQGRALLNAIGNLELTGAYAEALTKLGHDLESVARHEPDAALGNGGLGRLASCFLDSMATLNYPAWGYGLRYKYGLFKQRIAKDGQEEVAEDWLEMGNPWEIVRNDISYPVKFYGEVVSGSDGKKHWIGGEDIIAVAYDLPIPGYKTKSTINLRLWSTKAPAEDLDFFRHSILQLVNFIVCKYGKADPNIFEKKLKEMRILENVDLPSTFAGLTLKPKESSAAAISEASKLNVKDEVDSGDEPQSKGEPKSKGTQKKEEVMAEPPPKLVRMANLCVVGGHAVNGVAEIHSEIVKDEVFNAFYELWPNKFQNKTNGVTPRRWIRFCNPDLSKIITEWTGSEEWVLNTEKLAELRKFADNEDFQTQWRAAKKSNKMKVASLLKEKTGYSVSADAMFDIQVKRIHEYKRQLLNILGIVYRYKKMKEMSAVERKAKYVPRVCIFGGKAFATYAQAKRIVKFITDVGATVNHDPEIGDLLKVVFVPDYNVSVAELLIPASELSQHISTAGMEASGTSNMKFAMNGCILIGTLDGANVEIRQEVGEDNFFLFGAKAHEIAGLRKERVMGKFVPDPRFEEVKDFVRTGVFGCKYDEMLGSLEGNEGFGCGDYFLVGKDFPSYIECQEKVDEAYQDQRRWTNMSIMNTAGSYKFSSDRTIHEYAKDIWNIRPTILP
uniref:Alpha-1,4 glucan phosphorylase n=1 Tax=Manihot esculenta TaxID=3983 RepID=A0A2C9WB21_MANES